MSTSSLAVLIRDANRVSVTRPLPATVVPHFWISIAAQLLHKLSDRFCVTRVMSSHLWLCVKSRNNKKLEGSRRHSRTAHTTPNNTNTIILILMNLRNPKITNATDSACRESAIQRHCRQRNHQPQSQEDGREAVGSMRRRR